jgi:hypothetical protein
MPKFAVERAQVINSEKSQYMVEICGRTSGVED